MNVFVISIFSIYLQYIFKYSLFIKKLLIIISIITFSSKGFGYGVSGSHECGDIINEYKNDNKMMYQAVASWTQGYITARNYMSDSYKGRDANFHSLFYAVLNFCEDNPFKDIDDAALFIYSQF